MKNQLFFSEVDSFKNTETKKALKTFTLVVNLKLKRGEFVGNQKLSHSQ
jgi:hypothetical protein